MQPARPQAVRYERHVGVVLLVRSLPAGPSSCGLAAWSRQSQSEATPYPCTYRSSDDPTGIGVFCPPLKLVAAARHHQISIPRAAFGTVQQPHPAIVDGGRDRLGGGGPSKAGNGRSTPAPRASSPKPAAIYASSMKTRHSFISVAAPRFRLRRRRSNERRP